MSRIRNPDPEMSFFFNGFIFKPDHGVKLEATQSNTVPSNATLERLVVVRWGLTTSTPVVLVVLVLGCCGPGGALPCKQQSWFAIIPITTKTTPRTTKTINMTTRTTGVLVVNPRRITDLSRVISSHCFRFVLNTVVSTQQSLAYLIVSSGANIKWQTFRMF